MHFRKHGRISSRNKFDYYKMTSPFHPFDRSLGVNEIIINGVSEKNNFSQNSEPFLSREEGGTHL